MSHPLAYDDFRMKVYSNYTKAKIAAEEIATEYVDRGMFLLGPGGNPSLHRVHTLFLSDTERKIGNILEFDGIIIDVVNAGCSDPKDSLEYSFEHRPGNTIGCQCSKDTCSASCSCPCHGTTSI